MVPSMAPAASGRAVAAQRPSIGSSGSGSALRPAPLRRTFVLRHAAVRACAVPPAGEEEPRAEMARGVVLGAMLSKLLAGQSKDDATPGSKPAGVLGAALAALMMVRPAAWHARPRARIARARAAPARAVSGIRAPHPRALLLLPRACDAPAAHRARGRDAAAPGRAPACSHTPIAAVLLRRR